MSLGNNEKKMLRCMRSKQENIWTLEELLEITQWNDQVHVAGAGKSLDENEFVETIEKHMKFITLGSSLLYTSPSPRDQRGSRMPSSA